MTTYKMFIDDERFPNEVTWVAYPFDRDRFMILRSHDDVFEYIKTFGFPAFISFDHDLGVNEPTGKDIVNGLIEYDMEHDVIERDFSFVVHSMNPIGKKNIESLLNQYLAWKFEN